MMEQSDWLGREAVAVDNPDGRGKFVLVCDHASNWVPSALKGLGLPPGELERHIAWDPGALELARLLSNLLDAPLVHATVSRLVLDVNRDPTHPGSVVTRSEDTDIPGNQEIGAEDRARRVQSIYEPYHRALDAVIERSVTHDPSPQIVSVHSFTPVYRQEQRPWHIGVLSGEDKRLSQPLLELLRANGEFCVGDNQPYAPTDGVYHTLHRHCESRNLRSVLLELRSDTISAEDGREQWAARLERALQAIH
ncbi:MAG: N-formylglutamate amidohydrolase [Proteobacteria bacterium]|nr:N-formylglutamate amidohydrolase [Pseudomonadota bacterium]